VKNFLGNYINGQEIRSLGVQVWKSSINYVTLQIYSQISYRKTNIKVKLYYMLH